MSAHRSRFSGFGSSRRRGTAAGAVIACGVMLLAGCGGSGGSAADAGATVIRGDAEANAAVAQTALTVDTPSTGTVGTAGTAMVLSASGGSGTGTLTLTVTGTDCSVTDTSKLNATAAATCIVTAQKAASTGYLEATSAPKTFTFGAAAVAQAALTVSNTPLYGNVGTNIELVWSGGSGTGAVAFTVTGTGCSVIKVGNGKLKMTQAGNCFVTATRAASTGYLVATSAATTFTWYYPGAQDTLTVSNTKLDKGKVNEDITLGTLGGSGDGAVTYTVTGTGCSVSVNLLKGTKHNSYCAVTARKAASQGGWLEATSATKTFKIT